MGDNIWYWGTGSMINPVSLQGRGLEVLESHYSQLQNHECVFFGPNGYSAPVPANGETMWGVLHLITQATLNKINPLLEGSSDLTTVEATKGDGKVVECVTHVLNRVKMPASTDNLPKENYIAILVEGADHYRIPAEYKEMLLAKENRPRRTPDIFVTCPEPEEKKMFSVADVEAGGNTDGDPEKPCLTIFGNKVLEYLGPRDPTVFPNWGLFKSKFLGKRMVFEFSKLEYDPKYGVADSWEEMSPEAQAYYEDWMLTAFGGPVGFTRMFKPVGLVSD